MPGQYEWQMILLVAFFCYVIPVIFAVLLIVSHVRIHSSLRQLHQKLDRLRNPSGCGK